MAQVFSVDENGKIYQKVSIDKTNPPQVNLWQADHIHNQTDVNRWVARFLFGLGFVFTLTALAATSNEAVRNYLASDSSTIFFIALVFFGFGIYCEHTAATSDAEEALLRKPVSLTQRTLTFKPKLKTGSEVTVVVVFEYPQKNHSAEFVERLTTSVTMYFNNSLSNHETLADFGDDSLIYFTTLAEHAAETPYKELGMPMLRWYVLSIDGQKLKSKAPSWNVGESSTYRP